MIVYVVLSLCCLGWFVSICAFPAACARMPIQHCGRVAILKEERTK